jgi:hypothetical protein
VQSIELCDRSIDLSIVVVGLGPGRHKEAVGYIHRLLADNRPNALASNESNRSPARSRSSNRLLALLNCGGWQ